MMAFFNYFVSFLLLQTLFVGHPDKHPIVILKDVPYADMRSLLDFMYRGEVSVDQDRLTAFLKVCMFILLKILTIFFTFFAMFHSIL